MHARTRAKTARSGARPSSAAPADTLDSLRAAARSCRACPLWKCGTQTVFGEGSAQSRVMLVGEQPGDQEDLQGRPFVGPAGRLLDKALQEVSLERDAVYVTNAVKHFKWLPQGKRRLHKKPAAREVAACYPWLEREIATLTPKLIVCLGATAATTLLGRDFKVSTQRGQLIERTGQTMLATIHPSAVLRARDAASRATAYRGFVADLRLIKRALK